MTKAKTGLTLVLLVVTLLCSVMPVSYAQEVDGLDKSDVMDDLFTGNAFNILDYPYNPFGSVQVMNFVEYCYSYKANMQSNYGLYIYVYNPQQLAFVENSGQNKIQIATAFDADHNAIKYEKFSLECVSMSKGDYYQLFYKFKVVGAEKLLDVLNSNKRRYFISGIELLEYGNTNATEYGIGGTYVFSGYAKGYGPDATAESTLACDVEEFETINLKVHHTNYRTGMSNLGNNHYNEVNTVYFSVPNRYFEEYGNLQKIAAEWWEYKTKMAVVTANEEFYNKILPYVGTQIGDGVTAPFSVYSGANSTVSMNGYITCRYQWSFNKYIGTTTSVLGPTGSYSTDYDAKIIPYSFYSPTVNLDTVFDFLCKKVTAGSVESNVVQDWIYNYSNDLGHGYIDCNGRQISKDLFEEYVDEGRTMGYNNVEIDLGDTFDLDSYDSNHTWWDKLWDFGFSWPTTDEEHKNVAPIHILDGSELTGLKGDVSTNLLVNKEHVTDLQDYYSAETAKGNKVVLFRFAKTDYYSAPAVYTGYEGSIPESDTYVASETVFLDFDILSLTFHKDGVYKVIPAVSNPIDIVNGFTPPDTGKDIGKSLLSILLLIVLLVLLIICLPWILKVVWFLISTPFKALANLANDDKDKGDKR